MKLHGIHHVTCITGDAPQNVEYYTDTLGLRIVKKTVNQDDPTVYHLFYADELGSAGADITFFEYPGAIPGRAGDGMVHRISFRVGSEESLAFWENRVGGTRDDGALRFNDPEGLELELVVDDGVDSPLVAHHAEIPEEHAIRGFAGVRAFASNPERSASFLERLTFEGAHDRWESRGDRHGFYAYDPPPDGRRGVPGAGTGASRRVVGAARRARGLGAEGRRGRCAAHAGDRPVLVPLDLLPRAERRALRDRLARAGLHRRRAARAPRGEADPPACVRAPARPGRACADATAEPAAVIFRERPAHGEPAGALVLFHGRGADENDLFPLLDVLDPERRLHGYTPRGPLSLPPGGAHWYVVPRVGYPDPPTFSASYAEAGAWLRFTVSRTDRARRLLTGLRDGACPRSRCRPPRPTAIAGFSGFVPQVPGWELDADRPLPPVALGHGTLDPVIPVEFGRATRDRLLAAGAELLYKEYPLPHTLDSQFLVEVREWLAARLTTPAA